jgi:anti-sigma28 factor (negative regulator of flagellin synthesis)
MKIGKKTTSSTSYSSGVSAYQNNSKVEARANLDDSVEVSSSFSLVQKAVEELSQVPDIRAGAIEGIQNEFSNGTYHRDEAEVAEKVIQDHFKASS